MISIVVHPSEGLRGQLRVPGDKSISHRAYLLAALAEGTSTLRGTSTGDDVLATRAAVEALGAAVTDRGEGTVQVAGGALREPSRVLDLANSGTGIRLLTGLCAGLPFLTVLQGDQSVARRPMDRIVAPLRKMGARIDGRDGGRFAPLVVRGSGLLGIDYTLPVPSAQVKGAVLLAGLHADGGTTVREEMTSRAHTEELLALAGAWVQTDGRVTTVRPSDLHAFDLDVGGDPSQAAFWIVAGCLVPDSDVTIEHVYLGQARRGFVDVLQRMGADIEADEATGSLRVRPAALAATTIEASEVPGLVDEIPILAVAASRAMGDTVFRGVGELRVKETDRLATIGSELGALGVRVDVRGDELTVHGGSHLVGGRVRSHGDHRIAMAAAIASLAATAPTEIDGWESVSTSYPGFLEDLQALGGNSEDGAAVPPGGPSRGEVASEQ